MKAGFAKTTRCVYPIRIIIVQKEVTFKSVKKEPILWRSNLSDPI
jgi:hypothetical protein